MRKGLKTININIGPIMTATALILGGIVVIYLFAIRKIEANFRRKYEKSDEYLLSSLAMVRQCSTYKIFQDAGKKWGFSSQKIESDFNRYLSDMHIAHYVVRYVKENVTASDVKKQSIIHPPNSWSA